MVDESLIARVRSARESVDLATAHDSIVGATVTEDDFRLAWFAAEILDDDCALCLGQNVTYDRVAKRFRCNDCGDVMVRSQAGTLIADPGLV